MSFVAKTEGFANNVNLVGTKPAGLQGGDVLVAVIGTLNITYTPPDGWTLATEGYTHLGLRVYTKVASGPLGEASTEPASWTWVANAATYHNVVVLAYRGCDPTDPVFGTVSTAYGTFDPYIRCHNIASTPAGAIAIACGVYWYEEGPGEPPSGYTERADYRGGSTTAQVYACDRILAAGGDTGDQDIVLSANEDYKRGAHLVLRLAPAAAAAKPHYYYAQL